MLAVTTNTPLPQIWRTPIGVLIRYARRLELVLPLFNPFAVRKESDEAVTDPEEIRAIARAFGLKRSGNSHG